MQLPPWQKRWASQRIALSKEQRREDISRDCRKLAWVDRDELSCGLNPTMIGEGVRFTYKTLDTIDSTLVESGSSRLSKLVELANLSTIVGNLLAEGIVKASHGVFTRAGAHKYQDLRSTKSDANHVEIKVALEKNKPKAHLAKPGYYLTFRYVLSDGNGKAFDGDRGDIVWIWEIRFGYLKTSHFNISNTEGDSGKTAVVNADGMDALEVLYVDHELMPSRRKPKS